MTRSLLVLLLTLFAPLYAAGRAKDVIVFTVDVRPLLATDPVGEDPDDPAIWVQLENSDPKERAKAVERLFRPFDKSNLDLILKVGSSDPEPAVRKEVVTRLSRLPDPVVTEWLEHRVTDETDNSVALFALERLRVLQAQRLGELFDKRLNSAGESDELADQAQRWMTYARGATLPGFLQDPPPVFEAIPPRASVRVLAFGDFGTGSDEMRKTAAAAAAYHRTHAFDLGLTVGDNLPSNGVVSLSDPRWKSEWEDLYGPLGIPVFASTGNHDWGFSDSPAAEILYSQKSRTWRMPALYYSYRAGPVQFFALATQALSQTQLRWLNRELGRSTARWRIVYGHHPIYSYGPHGDTRDFDKTLLKVIGDRAQIYLAGHDHVPQHLKPVNGVHFVVTPAAGQSSRPEKSGPRTLYSGSYHGFAVIEAGPDNLTLRFVDIDGKTQYETTLK